MKNKKSYYYAAQLFPKGEDPFEYFEAYSKKQIVKWAKDNNRDVLAVFDPASKPVHGVYYKDITEVYVP